MSSISIFFVLLAPCNITYKDLYSNVVMVDWTDGAVFGSMGRGYIQPTVNTKVVGKQICSVIKAVRNAHPKMKFYLIGFSLGGHVSGFAGKECKNEEDGSPIIDKITGMCACVRIIFYNRIISSSSHHHCS